MGERGRYVGRRGREKSGEVEGDGRERFKKMVLLTAINCC